MQWIPKHSVRCASALALSACFCLVISPAGSSARADLTPAQLRQAIIEALWDYNLTVEALPVPSLGTGEFVTYPIDENYEPLSRYLGDGTGTGGAYLAQILDALLAVQGTTNISAQLGYLNGRTLKGALDDLSRDVWRMLTTVSNATFQVDEHGAELLVRDPHADDHLALIASLLGGLTVTASDILSGQGSTQGSVGTVASSVSEVVDGLDDVISELQTANLYLYPINDYFSDQTFDPDFQRPEFETNEVQLVRPSVARVDDSPLDEGFDDIHLQGSPIITLWEDVELGRVVIPAATIDLSSETMSPGVAMMGKISSTLWWLAYYTGIALLLRREFVYYTSLGSTEGAS